MEPVRQCSKCAKMLPFGCFTKHKEGRDGLRPDCRECRAAHKKQYYAANKARILEVNNQYRDANRDRVLEMQKQYGIANKERLAEHYKSWYAANREHGLAARKAYYIQNKDRLLELKKIRSRTESGKLSIRSCNTNRIARKRNALGSHTAQELQEQLVRQDHTCYYCKAKLGKERRSYHADHVVPLSRGGTNYIDNIVLTCRTCNLQKSNKLVHEWLGVDIHTLGKWR
jgi:5-methylcytosine-specific restriction endonuclease McrA